MLKEGMITEEEAEQYWKEHPNEASKDTRFLTFEELDKYGETKNKKTVELTKPASVFTSGDFAKYGEGVDLNKARGPIQEATIELPEGVWMRHATEKDLPNIIQWKIESVSEKIRDNPKTLNFIKKDAKDNLKDTKMIMSNDDVIGVLESCWIDNNEWWYIGEIYLIPAYRGKGIAKALLKLDIAGKDKVKLRVAKENKHAIDLYMSLGFKISEENDNSYIMIIDKTKPIQESWNDMKRGVNSRSKTLWFHISQSDKHEGKVFTPRVPEYLTKTKFGKDDPYYEDMEIPRVCFSPSIEGALHAITSPGDRIVMGGREYYVYIPEKPIDQYKRITNKELIDRKLVFDAKYTKECWITEPVKLILYGTIMVDQVSNVKLKPSVTGDAKLSVASFKWHWQVKPKAIKMQGHEYYAWNDEEDNKKTKKKKDKPIKEEYNMSDFVRDPSLLKMILEEDEPKEDEDKGDAIDADTDENNGSVETTTTDTEVELGIDVSGEQNQYNPEEVNRLNQLINSEMSAVSEYFNAAKESKEPNLMRLFSDIGDEERFHLEQLLYAKSMVTGEEYEPQDPKVKKEYKELLDLGLDEETAMTTAIDKVGLMPKEEEMSDEEEEDLKESFNMISILSGQTQMMLESIDTSNITDEMYNNSMQFLEQMYISEEVYNLNTKEGQKALGTKSPIRMIWNAFKAVYNFVISIVRKAKLAFQKIRIKNREKWAWLKRHGIKGIFQSGISLYFWNDRTGKYEIGDGIRYLQMVHLMNERVIKAASLNVNTSSYNIDKYVDSIVNACKGSKVAIEVKPVSVPSIQKGMNDLNSATLTKSKLIITDENEAMLEELFFGYTDQGYQIMEKEGDNSKNIKMSFNVYNQLNYLLSAFESVSNETKDIIEALAGMEGKPNTVYATNNKAYNECVTAMNITQKALNMFTKAVSSDIQTCLNVNTGLKEAMQKSDSEGNSQAAKEFNQNKQNAQTAGQEAKQNTKNENTPALSPR
jgi:ribosomal protein S18 acetylase RimI-like enzyme